jgi:hypothetical protein
VNICEQLELVVGNDQFCHCARLKVWLNAQFASELFAVASGVWQCGLMVSIQFWTIFSPIFVGEATPLPGEGGPAVLFDTNGRNLDELQVWGDGNATFSWGIQNYQLIINKLV